MSPRLSPALCEWLSPSPLIIVHTTVSALQRLWSQSLFVCERETSQLAAVTAGGVTCLFLLGAVRITRVHACVCNYTVHDWEVVDPCM